MLDYLFTAIYEDGTTFEQTQDDVSSKDSNRSAFYDIEQDKLIAFALQDEKNAIVVDLRDGTFQINGFTFSAYDGAVKNRRLIYFRRHKHAMNVDSGQADHQVSYFIGWQGNDPVTGENIQRTLEL
jgi:hypothetical protein